jgi:dienelactone hydrolase
VRAALVGAALLWAVRAVAVEPCTDVPGTATLVCRTAELAERTRTAGPDVAAATNQLAEGAQVVAGACDSGETRSAVRKLRRLRKAAALVGERLAIAREDGRVLGPDASSLVALASLVDALRRSTAERLRRHPCPELLDVLAPRPGAAKQANGPVPVLFTFQDDVEPGGVSVRMRDGRSETPVPVSLTATEGRAMVDCRGDTLIVEARATDGRTDVEEIPCGDPGLGAEVEVLIEEDVLPNALRITPVRPLASGATYAVVATTRLRGARGRRVVPSPAFRAALGLGGRGRRGIEARYATAPLDAQNPFPSNRLRRPDETIDLPDGFAARGVPAEPRLDGVRAFLAGLDLLDEEHTGFSASTAVVLQFDGPLKLEKTARAIRFVELPAPDAALLAGDPAALRDRLAARGIAARRLATATVFTVEPLGERLVQVRQQIVERAATAPPLVDFTDPEPSDARRFGIYHPADPEFATFFGGSPPASAGLVARGSFSSPDYRENGRFPARFLDGIDPPPHATIDFLLVTPVGPPPAGGYPTVILQHGFGGDNAFVAANAADFTAAGLAVIGIPAPEHGPRGTSFLDFFVFDDFNAFGNNFRQSTVDLLQLTRLIEAGIDVTGDAQPDLDASELGYLGVSMGGVIGATFCAVEPRIRACVLNVPGGKLAQFAGSVSSLATPFLTSFATDAGIPARTCNGIPTGPACTADAGCATNERCLFSNDFALMLDAALPSFQWQLDPGDGINYVAALRFGPDGPRPLLVQEGIGDVVVANPLTEALGRGAGLSVDRADASPQGVAALWRFSPPGGHDIFTQEEVRAQAVAFLASGGTQLPAP